MGSGAGRLQPACAGPRGCGGAGGAQHVELLQEADEALVDAILDSILEDPVEVIEHAEGEVEVIEVDGNLGREKLKGERDDRED